MSDDRGRYSSKPTSRRTRPPEDPLGKTVRDMAPMSLPPVPMSKSDRDMMIAHMAKMRDEIAASVNKSSNGSHRKELFVGIAGIVTALLGTGGVWGYQETQKTRIREDSAEIQKEMRANNEKMRSYLEGVYQDRQAEQAITIAVLCELNGGPPARGVRCPVAACEPRPLKETATSPICKAKEEWPQLRRPP